MTRDRQPDDVREYLKDMNARQDRTERGVMKRKVPELTEEPTHEVLEGAMLYVFEGALRARIGTTDYVVSITPV